jgi:hypothetical protein
MTSSSAAHRPKHAWKRPCAEVWRCSSCSFWTREARSGPNSFILIRVTIRYFVLCYLLGTMATKMALDLLILRFPDSQCRPRQRQAHLLTRRVLHAIASLARAVRFARQRQMYACLSPISSRSHVLRQFFCESAWRIWKSGSQVDRAAPHPHPHPHPCSHPHQSRAATPRRSWRSWSAFVALAWGSSRRKACLSVLQFELTDRCSLISIL